MTVKRWVAFVVVGVSIWLLGLVGVAGWGPVGALWALAGSGAACAGYFGAAAWDVFGPGTPRRGSR